MFTEETYLIQRVKKGDALAFARLHDMYYPTIYRFFYYRINNPQKIEEFSSELFIRATEELGFYKPGGIPFKSWLYTLARDLLMEHLLEEGEEDQPTESVESYTKAPANSAACLKQSVTHLDADERELIIARLIEERSSYMVAREINKSIRNTRMRLSLALSRLIQITQQENRSNET